MRLIVFMVILLVGADVGPASAQDVLIGAHAHNVYEHDRPLLDALDHGFHSIEVDVYLVDEELLVAHDRDDILPSRTLESLYLEPLRELIRRRDGSVYGEGTPLLILREVRCGDDLPCSPIRAPRLRRHHHDLCRRRRS